MVAEIRTFISDLFGTPAVAPPTTPTARPPVPVEDHAGGRYFTRSPEGHYVTEPIDAPDAPEAGAQTTTEDDGVDPQVAAIPQVHHRARSYGSRGAAALERPRPTRPQTGAK